RDDSLGELRANLKVRTTSARRGHHDRRDDRDAVQDLRNSSHKKTGPPMMAVMMPTGSSSGAMIVRATRSQPIRKAAPNSAAAGSTSRGSEPTIRRTRW